MHTKNEQVLEKRHFPTLPLTPLYLYLRDEKCVSGSLMKVFGDDSQNNYPCLTNLENTGEILRNKPELDLFCVTFASVIALKNRMTIEILIANPLKTR